MSVQDAKNKIYTSRAWRERGVWYIQDSLGNKYKATPSESRVLEKAAREIEDSKN